MFFFFIFVFIYPLFYLFRSFRSFRWFRFARFVSLFRGLVHALHARAACLQWYLLPNISGTGSEGWFDPWSLLNAFKKKAVSLGVEYITGEAVDFVTDQNGQITSIKVWTITRIQLENCSKQSVL